MNIQGGFRYGEDTGEGEDPGSGIRDCTGENWLKVKHILGGIGKMANKWVYMFSEGDMTMRNPVSYTHLILSS